MRSNEEMHRFLSPEVLTDKLTDKLWWENLLSILNEQVKTLDFGEGHNEK